MLHRYEINVEINNLLNNGEVNHIDTIMCGFGIETDKFNIGEEIQIIKDELSITAGNIKKRIEEKLNQQKK